MAASEATGNYLLENIHRVVYGQKNLEIARNHLQNGGSILVYFNHFSKLDAVLYAKIMREYLAPLNRVTAMTAMKHLDSQRGIFNRIQSALIHDWEDIYGLRVLPIVQTYDRSSYPNANEINRKSLRKVVRMLRQPGNIIAVAPEGTRSDKNKLLPAEEGFETLLRLGGENVLALGLAGVHKTILPGRKTIVTAVKPVSLRELKAEQKANPGITITDLAMQRIARELPPPNRGYYG